MTIIDLYLDASGVRKVPIGQVFVGIKRNRCAHDWAITSLRSL